MRDQGGLVMATAFQEHCLLLPFVRELADRPGFLDELAAQVVAQPRKEQMQRNLLHAVIVTTDVPPPAFDAVAAQASGYRNAPWPPIPRYLAAIPRERRARVIAEVLRKYPDNHAMMDLAALARTPEVLAAAVAMFEKQLAWSGEGLDERQAALVARSVGAEGAPLLRALLERPDVKSRVRIERALELIATSASG
jgi:hypothetical protein